MLKPNKQSAQKTDKVMLLAMWTEALKKERGQSGTGFESNSRDLKFISAGMGKPTFPIHDETIQAYLDYWTEMERLKKEIVSGIGEEENAAIGYGNPSGDHESREIMAEAMTKWYKTTIEADNLLFTVGGAGGLRVVFETFNSLYKDLPGYRLITPFPHYTLYADNSHLLHPVDVMKEPGYRLTAFKLRLSIEEAFSLAKKDGLYPKVILLCNPNNPLGTMITEDELLKIAKVLREYPDLHIVLDEAYAEMCFCRQTAPSFLTLAPDLAPRLIIMRSATKAFSAAGERMAVLMAFNPVLMGKLLDRNISTIGHAPRSAQLAYAKTMVQFTEDAHQKLVYFYHKKVMFIQSRLAAMGAMMPDPDYHVDGTFYILTDLSDLLGLPLPEEAKRVLEKTGPVETNEELAYYLLFNDSIMLAPGAYFGLPLKNGFMRITCSGGEEELTDLMDRLQSRLTLARQTIKIKLIESVTKQLGQLRSLDEDYCAQFMEKLGPILKEDETCLGLKQQNKALKEMHLDLSAQISRSTEVGCGLAAMKIQLFFKQHQARKEKVRISDAMDTEWRTFVDGLVPKSGPLKACLLSLPVAERLDLLSWREYLKNTVEERESRLIQRRAH